MQNEIMIWKKKTIFDLKLHNYYTEGVCNWKYLRDQEHYNRYIVIDLKSTEWIYQFTNYGVSKA